MTQHPKQVLEESIRHAPDDVSIGNSNENAGKTHFGTLGNLVVNGTRLLEHIGQWKPEGRLDLLHIDVEALCLDEIISVSGDDERWPRTRVADDVIELSEILGVREVDPDLLEGLTLGGPSCRVIVMFHAAAGKGHVPGPRIAVSHGSLDQQHLDGVFAFPKHDGHGGMRLGGQVGLVRLMRSQPLS